jgi:hypothetical protein
MSQSKRQSILEAIANTTIGYVVAVAAQEAIFPIFGLYMPFTTNLAMGLVFTAISLVRSYVLRRVFNRRERA